jgi:hypothetical protein
MSIHLSNALLTDFVGGEVAIVNRDQKTSSLGKAESFSIQGNELRITWTWLATREGSSVWLKSSQKETHVPVWGNPPLGEYMALGRVKLAHQRNPTVTLFPPGYFRKHTLEELLALD